jgi:hypothetical protein
MARLALDHVAGTPDGTRLCPTFEST